MLNACASDASEQPESQPVASLEVNEAGEYVFPDDKGDEVVCKRIRRTGSHFPEKVCKTRRQMAEDERKVMESYGPLGVEAGDERRF